MSDPLLPPPRRPAPAQLRERVLADLRQAPSHRVRPRHLVLPAAAAAAVTAVVVGVSSLGGHSSIAPAQTASPAPPSTSASAPKPTPTPKAPVNLDIRSMTKAEIAADTKSCRVVDKGDTEPIPQRGKPKALFAMVQSVGGLSGASSKQIRMVLSADDVGVWTCEDGSNTEWSADGLDDAGTSGAVPAAEVPNYGGTSASCGGTDPQATSTELFAVRDKVKTSRMRMIKGKSAGPWMTATPYEDYVHFIFRVRGEDARAKNVSVQFQFLGADGRPVTMQPYGPRGTKTTSTYTTKVETCTDLPGRHKPRALTRPKSNQAGVATCLKMGCW